MCSTYELSTEDYGRFHSDGVCDRSEYNAFKQSLNRHRIHKRLMVNNDVNRVPNAQTVFCPLQVQDLTQTETNIPGFDTMWLVENTSSESVVLSFVDPKDGIEYSALTGTITPPQNDPKAIVPPGGSKAVRAYDGHVFHARTFNADTGALGPVVLQHRLGLIPVGLNAPDHLSCPLEDPEPVVPETGELQPEFSRLPPRVFRPCNTIDIGFRNMAGCPLHGYYIAGSANSNSTNDAVCQEKFRFHLGMNRQAPDFMWSWDSPTKFEGSFVGHAFSFRLASDPSVLVETVTLQPTRIVDCPELSSQAQVNQVTRLGDLVEVGLPVSGDDSTIMGITQADHLEDVMVRVNQAKAAGFFNDTAAAWNTHNGTTRADKPKRRSRMSRNEIYVGVDSF
jgi:hypothetical protein